jgi:ribosome-associated protein
MDIRKLQRVIVDGLEDVKAQNIVVFNTEHLSSLFERVIVASGTSNRQTKSLAASVRDAVKAAGAPPPRTEGEANGEWIIVDCGAAVVHVMQPAIRDYYHLEELWGEKPVKMKIASAMPRLVKAAPPAREAAGSREAGKPRAAAQRSAPAPRAAPPKRATVGRVTPAKRVVRTVGTKSSAAKTTTRTAARPAAKRAAPKR